MKSANCLGVYHLHQYEFNTIKKIGKKFYEESYCGRCGKKKLEKLSALETDSTTKIFN